MVRDLITLPLRIGAFAGRAGLHAAGRLRSAAARLVEMALPTPVETAGTERRDAASSSGRVDIVVARPALNEETRATQAAARPRIDARPAPEAGPIALQRTPAHMSAEPQLVEAFAQPGAEEGVGAVVHVREPWEGYAQMTAKEVVARMADAGREELAAVELYERAHRSRRTVVAAADRRLRQATAADGDRPAAGAGRRGGRAASV